MTLHTPSDLQKRETTLHTSPDLQKHTGGRLMNAAATSLLDQAQAATTHSLNAMYAAAQQDDGRIIYAVPGPISARILAKLDKLITTGQLGMCPHLKPRAPQPAVWLPWAPGKLRCAPCTQKPAQRLHGSREDKRCDHCQRFAVRLKPIAVQLPAVVINLKAIAPFAMPPIQVQFHLCSTCHDVDQAGAVPITEVTADGH